MFVGRKQSYWLWDYERIQWEANSDIAPYNETDIVYEFNSHGYRGTEFTQRSELNILVIGCSYTFGTGLPYHDVYHQILANRLDETTGKKTTVWNLALPGVSNDFIARTLQHCLYSLNPDILVINFTFLPRREYFSEENKRYDYIPQVVPEWFPPFLDTWQRFNALISTHEDRANFIRNYNLVSGVLRDRKWIVVASHEAVIETLSDIKSLGNYAGCPHIKGNELPSQFARDLLHPGKQMNIDLATLCFDKIIELGYLK